MAATVLEWRVWCSTESAWKSVYLPDTEPEPTTCPTDTSHSVDVALTSQKPYLKSNDVELANVPKTSDGRIIISPAVFSGDQNLNYPGVGDDVAAGTRGGNTTPFVVDAAADTRVNNVITKEWQFIDHTYVQGGQVEFYNGGKNDFVDMDIYAPAAVPVASVGGNTGNANLSPTGLGYNIIVPAPLSDGTHDLDVSEPLNANLAAKPLGWPTLVTKVAPVPAIKKVNGVDSPDGFWDYDMNTGIITPNIGPSGEKLGYWNLFDADIILVRWITRLSLWNLGASGPRKIEYKVPVKAKKVIPQWICRASWNIEGTNPTFSGVWHLYTARDYTT